MNTIKVSYTIFFVIIAICLCTAIQAMKRQISDADIALFKQTIITATPRQKAFAIPPTYNPQYATNLIIKPLIITSHNNDAIHILAEKPQTPFHRKENSDTSIDMSLLKIAYHAKKIHTLLAKDSILKDISRLISKKCGDHLLEISCLLSKDLFIELYQKKSTKKQRDLLFKQMNNCLSASASFLEKLEKEFAQNKFEKMPCYMQQSKRHDLLHNLCENMGIFAVKLDNLKKREELLIRRHSFIAKETHAQ